MRIRIVGIADQIINGYAEIPGNLGNLIDCGRMVVPIPGGASAKVDFAFQPCDTDIFLLTKGGDTVNHTQIFTFKFK